MDYETEELRATDLYYRQDYESARRIYQSILLMDVDLHIKENCNFNIAACLASERQYLEALELFSRAEVDNKTLYNRALCNYKIGNYEEALKSLDELLEGSARPLKELTLTMNKLAADARTELDQELISKLEATCLMEAINLKSAISYKLHGSCTRAADILESVPIKSEELLDAVTLLNQAIYTCPQDMSASISKALHLWTLAQPEGNTTSVPIELYRNLFMLYLHSRAVDEAKELFESHTSLLAPDSPKELMQFLDLQLKRDATPDDLFVKKLDKLLDSVVVGIGDMSSWPKRRSETPMPSGEARQLVHLALTIVADESIVLWRNCRYKMIQRLMVRVKAIFSANNMDDVWKRIMAHVLFMMDTKFEKCFQIYEDLLPKSSTASILSVDPTSLANLCVAYVLTSRNGAAEELIKEVEEEEEGERANQVVGRGDFLFEFSRNPTNNSVGSYPSVADSNMTNIMSSHSGAINLAIATLYCVKNNYEFGLARLFKTLEPLERKLDELAWFHVKRCILSLLDGHCKQVFYAKDDLFDQIIRFLMRCESFGMGTIASQTDSRKNVGQVRRGETADYSLNIAHEAMYLRSVMLPIIHD